MMRTSHFISIWVILLLGAGTLLISWRYTDIIQLLTPGFMSKAAPEKDDVLLHPNPPANNSLNTTNSIFASFENSSTSSKEEWQSQLRVQALRQHTLADICSLIQPSLLRQVPAGQQLYQLYVEDRFKLVYCEVPKVSCSNWKRVLIVLAGKSTPLLTIHHYEAHTDRHLKLLKNYNPEGIAERLNKYTKVLFVRDPFERLVSAFRDKMENPENYYHKTYGRDIISRYRTNASESALRTGDGVTFREFVHYLLDPRRPRVLNIHWKPVSMLCSPCQFHFDFIGKFENMTSEANFLLQRIRAPPDVRFPDYKDRNPQVPRTSTSIMKKYFSQLNATERQGVYNFYRQDYLMFNYAKPLPDLV